MARPINVDGNATPKTAPAPRRRPIGLVVASVATAAMSTTGKSDTNVITRPASTRPANLGPGPAGRVRVNGSHGCARSSATPTPYANRLLVMTAKVTIEAVA